MGCISNNMCAQQQLTFCKTVPPHTDCSGICASALKDIRHTRFSAEATVGQDWKRIH